MFQNQCAEYHSVEAASGVVTDQDITGIAGFSAIFTAKAIGISKHTIIRTDAAITVRFNAVGNAAITLSANEKLEVDWLGISAIFVTAASSANLKVIVGR